MKAPRGPMAPVHESWAKPLTVATLVEQLQALPDQEREIEILVFQAGTVYRKQPFHVSDWDEKVVIR